MNKKIFSVLCLFGLLIIASATEYEEEEGVLVLKDSNFDQALTEFPHILIEFYARKCYLDLKALP
jgi:hypothetical protein